MLDMGVKGFVSLYFLKFFSQDFTPGDYLLLYVQWGRRGGRVRRQPGLYPRPGGRAGHLYLYRIQGIHQMVQL